MSKHICWHFSRRRRCKKRGFDRMDLPEVIPTRGEITPSLLGTEWEKRISSSTRCKAGHHAELQTPHLAQVNI